MQSAPELHIKLKERETTASSRSYGNPLAFSQICKYLFSLFSLPKNDGNIVDLINNREVFSPTASTLRLVLDGILRVGSCWSFR